MALLFADEPVKNMKFDGDSNDWDSSDIKRWLNEDFYRAAFNEEERDAILTSAYRYGGEYKGSDKTAVSKVFLLSTDEAEDGRYFASDADRAIGEWWWLRSPGFLGIAAFVYNDGEVFGGGSIDCVGEERAVRPALKINLASSIFTSSASASKYEILYGVKLKVRDMDMHLIYGAEVDAGSPEQKYYTGGRGTVELKLGAGKQKIRISAKSAKGGEWAKEVELNVETGGGSVNVDMELVSVAPYYTEDRAASGEVFGEVRGDFFGDGRTALVELVYVDDHTWPCYFLRYADPKTRDTKHYPLNLYATIPSMNPDFKANDTDGDGIPEILVVYHAGGTGGREFSPTSLKGGKPRSLCGTDSMWDGGWIYDGEIEYPDIDFKLLDGFRIKAHYAGKETVYKVSDSSEAGYFFNSEGNLSEEAFLDIYLTSKFLGVDLVDTDGDGISEIKSSLIIGGAGTNASRFGDVDVVFVWKDGNLWARDVEIRFR
jgi:hypothetical protein